MTFGSIRRDPAPRDLKVGGVTTHYLDAGDGEPLVLLHGGEFGAGAEVTWHRCLTPLSRGRRVIAIDLLGFGRSDKVRDLVDQRGRIVSQVADVLDALCVASADLVTASFSARLALDVAAATPGRWPARSIVAIGLGSRPPSRDARAALGAFDGSTASMQPTLDLLFSDPKVRDDERAARMRLALLPGAWQSGRVPTIGRPADAASSPPPAPVDYGAIDVPVLLVVGEHDAIVPRSEVDELAAAIPSSRVVVVAGAGHYPQVERPAETVAVIEEFLATGASTEAARVG